MDASVQAPADERRQPWRPAGSVLVLHVSPDGVSAVVVTDTGAFRHPQRTAVAAGDGQALAGAVLGTARSAIAAEGGVRAVAIVAPAGPLVAWDPEDGTAVAMEAGPDGATGPAGWDGPRLGAWLDRVDPDRRRGLVLGPLDSWVLWTLTEGARHSTTSGAAPAGLLVGGGTVPNGAWDETALAAARVHPWSLPQLGLSIGPLAEAIGLTFCPPVLAAVDEVAAALLGAGCTRAGDLVVLTAPATSRPDRGRVVVAWVGPDGPSAWRSYVALASRDRAGIEVRSAVVDASATAVAEAVRSCRAAAASSGRTPGRVVVVGPDPVLPAGPTPDATATSPTAGGAEITADPLFLATITEAAGVAVTVVPRHVVARGGALAAGLALRRWSSPHEVPPLS